MTKTIRARSSKAANPHSDVDDVLCAVDRRSSALSTAMYQRIDGKLEVRSVHDRNTLRQLLSCTLAFDKGVPDQHENYSRLIGHCLTSASHSTSNSWLKDGDIFDYFLIKSKAVNEINSVAVMDPSYFRDGVFQKNFFIRHIQNPKYSLSRQLEKARYIACPIVYGNHYYLLILHQIEPNKFKIGCLDGFNNLNAHQILFDQAKSCLKSFKGNEIEVDTQSYLIPRQNNQVDCGVVVAYYYERFCQTVVDYPSASLEDCFFQYSRYENEQCDYSFFRSQIAGSALIASAPHLEAPFNTKKTLTPAYQHQCNKHPQQPFSQGDIPRKKLKSYFA